MYIDDSDYCCVGFSIEVLLMYLRPVNPSNECKTCRYLTKIFKSDDGRRFCDFLEKFVSEDSLCPEHRR